MTETASSSESSPAAPNPYRLGWAVFLATGCWLGAAAPVAPGTIGAVWGVPLAWAINHIPSALGLPAALLQALVIAGLFLVGVPLCTVAQRKLGRKDPGMVVWDEIVTLPVTFFLVPVAFMNSGWVLLAGFVLHRIFDISKPPPCRALEKLPEGWGVMSDDLAAAVYSCLVLHALIWMGAFGWVVG